MKFLKLILTPYLRWYLIFFQLKKLNFKSNLSLKKQTTNLFSRVNHYRSAPCERLNFLSLRCEVRLMLIWIQQLKVVSMKYSANCVVSSIKFEKIKFDMQGIFNCSEVSFDHFCSRRTSTKVYSLSIHFWTNPWVPFDDNSEKFRKKN